MARDPGLVVERVMQPGELGRLERIKHPGPAGVFRLSSTTIHLST